MAHSADFDQKEDKVILIEKYYSLTLTKEQSSAEVQPRVQQKPYPEIRQSLSVTGFLRKLINN